MEWIEKECLPDKCGDCMNDCYNCDYAEERWRLSEKDSLMLKRTSLKKAVERFQRQIEEIDRKLAEHTDAM